ncbi:hypothetical protein HYU95_00535 [Candidatus Daviesbacteria bacterium]|nr:hypothetical protein [Candidatus Daviesbacteria bacterium]
MYAISAERRRGPLGIFKKRTPAGQLSEGSSYSFQLGGNNVVDLTLDKHHVLTIKTNHPKETVVVEFSAEPVRTRPEIVVRLDNNNPEIQTFRRQIAIALEDDSRQVLILKAPKFQPRYMSTREVAEGVVASLFSIK